MYAKFTRKAEVLKPYHHVNLDREFKEDCRVWLRFLNSSEMSILRQMVDFSENDNNMVLDFYTDASGGVEDGGFGCAFEHRWSFGTWNKAFLKEKKPSIEFLELAALTFGIFMWKDELKNKRITIFCDNTAVVGMVNKLASSCKNCMTLLRMITLLTLEENFRIKVNYVASIDNGIADALSRRDWKRFEQLTEHKWMNSSPDDVPSELWPIEKLWKD